MSNISGIIPSDTDTNDSHPCRLFSITTDEGKPNIILVLGGNTPSMRDIHNDADTTGILPPVLQSIDCLSNWYGKDDKVTAASVYNCKLDVNESLIVVGFHSGNSMKVTLSDFMKIVNEEEFDKEQIGKGLIDVHAPVRDIQFHPQSTAVVTIISEIDSTVVCDHESSNSFVWWKPIRDREEVVGCKIHTLGFSTNGNFIAAVGMENELHIWYTSMERLPDDHCHIFDEWRTIHKETSFADDPFDPFCQPYVHELR